MNALAKKLADDALSLSDNDRAELADVLLLSLRPPGAEEIDQAWAEEAERRVKEIDSGEVELLDGEKVLQEARARLLSVAGPLLS